MDWIHQTQDMIQWLSIMDSKLLGSKTIWRHLALMSNDWLQKKKLIWMIGWLVATVVIQLFRHYTDNRWKSG